MSTGYEISPIFKAWQAGFVRRWHTNPIMVRTNDSDSGHQHRCTILLLLFFPDSSRDAIIDFIVHDQGEHDVGDFPYPMKRKNPEIADTLQKMEEDSIAEQGFVFEITDEELKRRKFVDLLDSYLWMMAHFPHMRKDPLWEKQFDLLIKQAVSMDVVEKLYALFKNMNETYCP